MRQGYRKFPAPLSCPLVGMTPCVRESPVEPVIAGRIPNRYCRGEGQMSVRYFAERYPLFGGGVPLIRRFHKTVEPNRTIHHLGRMPLIRCSLGQGVPKMDTPLPESGHPIGVFHVGAPLRFRGHHCRKLQHFAKSGKRAPNQYPLFGGHHRHSCRT